MLTLANLLFLAILSACGKSGEAAGGQELYFSRGCSACHARDDSYSVGPSWKGLYGSQVELDDGTMVIADDAYLLEAILVPDAKIVKGYPPGSMPAGGLTESDAKQLVEYIKTVR
ncbi:MAG: c-type cytochrome [Chloroflexota bacterium]